MVVETETIVHNLWDCVNSYLSYMHYIALPIVGTASAVKSAGFEHEEKGRIFRIQIVGFGYMPVKRIAILQEEALYFRMCAEFAFRLTQPYLTVGMVLKCIPH